MFHQWVVLLFLTTTTTSWADTVLLASCPQEPEVLGTFVNNGYHCVREQIVLSREIIDAECPPEYDYRNGYCRKRLSKNLKPTCPLKEGSTNQTNYQRYGDKCHKYCPKEYRQKYNECILPRLVLTTKYMTCPEGYHRYEAYCCIPGDNCPLITCNVGDNVPGKFFYQEETGICERQAESIPRKTTSRPPNTPCPEGTTQIWGNCQEPCPIGFRPAKGRCDLLPCTFSPMTDRFVTCPEGTYTVAQAIF